MACSHTTMQAGFNQKQQSLPTTSQLSTSQPAYQRSSLATLKRSTAECGAPGQKHQILLRPLLQQVPRDQCTSNQRSLTPQAPDEVITLLILYHCTLQGFQSHPKVGGEGATHNSGILAIRHTGINPDGLLHRWASGLSKNP